MIQEKGIFKHYINTLSSTSQDPQERRTAMWSLGQMINSQNGFNHFEKDSERVVKLLIFIAENSSTLSDRGTAFYVICMLSSLAEVREVIENCGWEANEGESLMAFPRDLSKSGFMKVDLRTDFIKPDSESFLHVLEEQVKLHDLKTNDAKNVVYLAGRMVNRITSEFTGKIFASFSSKSDPPEDLQSAKVLFQIYKLMENFKMDMNYRGIIHNIFKHVDFEGLFQLFDQEAERNQGSTFF